MVAEERVRGILRVARFVGLAIVVSIAFVGKAQPAEALQECFDQFNGCMTAEQCVAIVNQECRYGSCVGAIKCMPGFGCESPTNVAAVCVMEPE
jgi:hypothetical protein